MFYLKKKFAHLFPKQHLTIFFLLFYDILNNDSVLFYDLSSSTFLILLKLLLRYLIPLYQILPLLRNLISLIQILMVMFMLRLSCVDSDGVVPDISIPTVVVDDFQYVTGFTDNVVPSEISPPIPSKNNPYLNFQRERECKSCNLERIIRAISSPQKNETQSNCSYTEVDSQDNQYETTICNAVI